MNIMDLKNEKKSLKIINICENDPLYASLYYFLSKGNKFLVILKQFTTLNFLKSELKISALIMLQSRE